MSAAGKSRLRADATGKLGAVRHETARLAGPTLIWTTGPVTYRLEGIATVGEAVAVANSVA